MRQFQAILIALTLAFAAGPACDKGETDAPAAKAEKTEKTAAPAEKAEKKPAAAAPEGVPAAKPAAKPAAAAPATAGKATDVPGAAGAALPISDAKLDEMAGHVDALTKVLEASGGDKAKLLADIDAYMKENGAAIKALKKAMDDAQAKLTPERQAELSMRLLGKMGTSLQRMQKFFTDHPELAKDPEVSAKLSSVQ